MPTRFKKREASAWTAANAGGFFSAAAKAVKHGCTSIRTALFVPNARRRYVATTSLSLRAFVKSYVADETVGDSGPLFRSLWRLSCLFDYLLLDLVPSKTFPDLDDTRRLEIDDDSCGLALFGFTVHPPNDGIGV